MTTLKGAIGAALIGVAALLPGTALASATPTAPAAPKPKCQEAENRLCPPEYATGSDVKAKAPRGYRVPKIPRGY